MTNDQVLGLLTAAGDWLSGEEMSRALGVTRAAVWKAVDALRREGCVITSAPRLGYKLETAPDRLSPAAISARLPGGLALGQEIICLDTVDSTNTYLKKLAAEGGRHGTVAIADEQTGGRGRRERTFQSPRGAGLYLSVLLRPSCLPMEAVDLTAWVAVAVCNAIETLCGTRPDIKWTNDLLLHGRKLCGILTEMGIEGESGALQYVVAGAGINLRQSRADFAALGLEETATSLAAEGLDKGLDRCALAAALITELDTMAAQFPARRADWLSRYRAGCITAGRRVLVVRGDRADPALALGVEDDFSLRVRWDDGREETVSAGEVSIRGLMGIN